MVSGSNNAVGGSLIGEIGCVTRAIRKHKRGRVRIYGREYPAKYKHRVSRGRWVRVLSDSGGVLDVRPLNMWLGSCCC